MSPSKFISVFDKSNNNLLFEWEINIDTAILKEIFVAYSDDPELMMVYPFNRKIAKNLVKYQNFHFDFERNLYEMITYFI